MDNTGKPIDLKITCKMDIYPNELSLPCLSSHPFFLLEIISLYLFPLGRQYLSIFSYLVGMVAATPSHTKCSG